MTGQRKQYTAEFKRAFNVPVAREAVLDLWLELDLALTIAALAPHGNLYLST